MKFSVIICTYNSSKTLAKTLDSVFNQAFQDFEVVIVDGASSDDTLNIIKDYVKKFSGRLNWISEKDRGVYDAMNKGIALAKGEWLYFLGSDDTFFDKEVLNNINEKTNSQLDIIYGQVALGKTNRTYGEEFNEKKIIKKNISHQAIFYRRDIFDKLGPYNIQFKVLADWDFNLRWFGNRNIKRVFLNRIIARYGQDGLSKDTFDKQFYDQLEANIKKYFPPEYWKFFDWKKRGELFCYRNSFLRLSWKWKNKMVFAILHPKDFIEKYFS